MLTRRRRSRPWVPDAHSRALQDDRLRVPTRTNAPPRHPRRSAKRAERGPRSSKCHRAARRGPFTSHPRACSEDSARCRSATWHSSGAGLFLRADGQYFSLSPPAGRGRGEGQADMPTCRPRGCPEATPRTGARRSPGRLGGAFTPSASRARPPRSRRRIRRGGRTARRPSSHSLRQWRGPGRARPVGQARAG